MSLNFGPRKMGIGVTDASQITVVNALTGEPATLSSPISVTENSRVSFTVADPGRYRVSARSAYYNETITVDLADDLPYDSRDLRSMVEYLINNGGGGEGGPVTWSAIIGKPTTFAPTAHSHTSTDITDFEDAVNAIVAGVGGAVDSVNGETGVVVLDSTDIHMVLNPEVTVEDAVYGLNDSINVLAARWFEPIEEGNIVVVRDSINGGADDSGIAVSTITDLQTNKSDINHTHVSANVTDLTESVQDILGAAIVEGSNVTVDYDDATGTVTISSTGQVSGDVDWSDVLNKPSFSTVSTSGSYTDLSNTPAIPEIGFSSTQAKPGDWVPSVTDIENASLVGTAVLSANDAEAARSILGVPPLGHTHSKTDITGISEVGTTLNAITTTGDALSYLGAAPTTHTHTATQISNSTTVGRAVMTATDATAARTAIGAGTSSLALGTTASTAKAGNWTPVAANISDSTAVGRSVLTAADAAAARAAIGAGTSSLVIGTSGTTAKAGNWTPTIADVADLQDTLDTIVVSSNSSVSGVEYYPTVDDLPATGTPGVIYFVPAEV